MLALVVVTLQALSGAYRAELASNPDEPAHFVSGVMVRDYLAGGLGRSPVAYAREYYAHYPKVAIGNWPPLFYAVEGAWMLLFSVRPASALVLMATLTAALGWVVFRTLRPAIGGTHAALGAAVFLLLPPVQTDAGLVMLEIPLALVSTIAVCAWGRFLDRGRPRDAAAFGVLAALAVMTKGNGVFLALVPPLSVLLTRRWHVLRSRALWSAAAVVLLLAGYWTWHFMDIVRVGWPPIGPSVVASWGTLVVLSSALPGATGYVLLIAAAVGAWSRLAHRRPSRAEGDGPWVSAAAAFGAVILFHSVLPVGRDPRHLIYAYPAVAMFAAAGTHATADWLRRRGAGAAVANAVAIGVVGVAFVAEAFRLAPKHYDGYGAAASFVLGQAGRAERNVSLIVSDATGEGAYIAEVAVRDGARPRHVVWRASKALARTTWSGSRYVPRAPNEAAVVRQLQRAAVRTLVVDRSVVVLPHQRLVDRTIAAYPDRFVLLRRLPLRRADRVYADGIGVYAFVSRPDPVAQREPPLRQVPGFMGSWPGFEPRAR